jgi:hypothetical protein
VNGDNPEALLFAGLFSSGFIFVPMPYKTHCRKAVPFEHLYDTCFIFLSFG